MLVHESPSRRPISVSGACSTVFCNRFSCGACRACGAWAAHSTDGLHRWAGARDSTNVCTVSPRRVQTFQRGAGDHAWHETGVCCSCHTCQPCQPWGSSDGYRPSIAACSHLWLPETTDAWPRRPESAVGAVVHGFPHRVSRVVYVAYVDNVEYGRIIGKALPAGPGSDRTPRWGPKSDLLTVDDSSIDVEKIGSEPVERPRKRGVS